MDREGCRVGVGWSQWIDREGGRKGPRTQEEQGKPCCTERLDHRCGWDRRMGIRDGQSSLREGSRGDLGGESEMGGEIWEDRGIGYSREGQGG